MTPTELAEYLKVLKDAGVASGGFTINGVTVNVLFEAAAMAPDFGKALEPGGWKSPTRLDGPDVYDLGEQETKLQ